MYVCISLYDCNFTWKENTLEGHGVVRGFDGRGMGHHIVAERVGFRKLFISYFNALDSACG